MSDKGNVLPFRIPEVKAGPIVINMDASYFVHGVIGDLRERAMRKAHTHSGRNVLIQTLVLVARGLLKEYADSTGSTLTASGMHRRNTFMRACELLELASDLAALDVHPDETSG